MSDHPLTPPRPQAEDLATWLAGAPASWLLGAFFSLQLVLWVPQYLVWPLWADHDVFATAALGWAHGLLPYRDLLGNNFPGQLYVFYGLGRLFGWGRPELFWAFDAALLVAFSGLVLVWSRRQFGRLLPGWVVLGALFAFYFDQDYTQAGQRDGQAALLALGSLMSLAVGPGAGGIVLSAVLFAAGLAVRPQVVLFGPAVALALAAQVRARQPGSSWRAVMPVAAGRLLGWGLLVAAGVALWLYPLWRAGVLDDFVRSLRLVAYGGSYNRSSGLTVLKNLVRELQQPRLVATATVLGLLGWLQRDRGPAWIALATLGGLLLYQPISPMSHHYLEQPLTMAWAWSLGPLVALILERFRSSAWNQWIALGLLVALAAPSWPRYSQPTSSIRAIRALARGELSEQTPAGYGINPEVRSAGRYSWEDYAALLRFLKQDLPPGTRVANALGSVPAVTGPTGRLPAFPAESIAWLIMVRPGDQERFVQALEAAPDSVVAWNPRDEPLRGGARTTDLPVLEAAIRRLYTPWRQFGALEVWRRRTASPGVSASLRAGSPQHRSAF